MFYDDSLGASTGGRTGAAQREREAAEAAGTADQTMFDSFKAKVKRWWQDVEELRRADVSDNPQLDVDKQKLISRANIIRGTIEKVPGLDSVGLGELALVPLIPIAIITGILAVIGKWATDFIKWKAQYTEYQALKKAGTDPAIAAQISKQVAGKTPLISTEGLGKAGIMAGLAGSLFLYAKYKGWV